MTMTVTRMIKLY